MKRLFILTLSLGMLFAIASSVSAQSKKRPKPLATPLPTLSGAEIISRSGDYDEPVTTVPVPQKTPSTTSTRIRDLSQRMDKLEAAKKEDTEAKQRRMLLNLDILTRAEQRSESLRKQLFEMTEKENTIRLRLDQIDIDLRPDMIERSVQIAGTLRPEEVRDSKRRSLESERSNLVNMLAQIETTKATLAASLDKADALVDKLRSKLDREIDETFLKDEQKTDDGPETP